MPLDRDPGREPDRDTVQLDARTLRGLAHPLRVRILGLLRREGPSTATVLAARLNLSSAATSYHLRQLETYRFIVEEVGMGQPRERWWKAAHRTTTFDYRTLATDPEATEASEVYLRGVAQAYVTQLESALDERPHLPPEWRAAGTLSDMPLRLTPAEADELCERIWTVVEGYRREDAPTEDAPQGSRPVTVQLQVFARPGDVS